MKHLHFGSILAVMVGLSWLAGCASVPRIDGRSDASFEQSHTELMKALTPADQLRLILAEALIMAPRGCIGSEPIPDNPWLTEVLGGQAVIRTCRTELDGMSFEDIMVLAYPDKPPVAQPRARPN